jgi:3-isopropylmalate/(R)-2-methylmalate dehydratase large subunit
MAQGRTSFEKIWDAHVVSALGGDRCLIHIDRHLVHEGTSRNAFDGLRARGRRPKSLGLTVGVVDHDPSTLPGRTVDTYPLGRERIIAMQANCREFGIELVDLHDPRQGIVHVIGPELGITLPGCTLVCGDSHTATSGGLGAWAWGIGTTEVERVLATQTLVQKKPRNMRVSFVGRMSPGIFAKDLVLYLIGQHGIAAGLGHVVEYAGPVIRGLPIEGRLTICNMSIELGARAGLVTPDDLTFEYLAGRPFAPQGAMWDLAMAEWRALPSDEDARFDREIEIDCTRIKPQISWGTLPQDVIAIDERIPLPEQQVPNRRETMAGALDYMGLEAGQRMEGVPIDYAFIGSCTNARLSDLEIAARFVKGRKVAEGVTAMVVPGSSQVKRAAEAIGLDAIFKEAGFEWRESGCSMCQTLGGDSVPPGKRCISTSNRNFDGRQGPRARTHLASPAMVAAAAVAGAIVDIRKIAH